MKLTIKQEKEVMQVYNALWDSYLKGDMKAMTSFLDDDFKGIGSTEGEVFFNKKEAMRFYKATAAQIAGKAEFRNRSIKMKPIDGLILITEQADFYILIDGEWTFYSKVRLSSLLQKKEKDWKFIQLHSSLPDTRAEEGEQVASEKIAAENLQLRDAIKRRTIELEHKNRELELEAALEKVRSSALAMKKTADMVDVCRIISDQLQLLKVKHIRNIQTAIINETKGIYLNYEYFTQYKTTSVLEIEIKLHPVVIEFVNEIQKSSDAFFTKAFKGEALVDWREYRKKTNQNADPILDEVKSVHYYFYSIGPGALGVSTYAPLNEEDIAVFKRFRNVFDLAYRRFIDIELAIAQTKEARLETALERVRARTMAMQKSEELKEVIQVVYEQFVHLNIYIEHTGFVMDYKARDDYDIWIADKLGAPSQVTIPYFDSVYYNRFNEAKEKGMDFFATNLTFEEKNRFYQKLFKYVPGLPEEAKEFLFSCPGLAVSTVLLENVCLYIENFSGISYSDEENNTLMRFGNVFQQTYTRFQDLQKAEAQAREAQIEAGLEKIRSKALAMHNSADMIYTAKEIFNVLKELGLKPVRSGLSVVIDAKKKEWDAWSITEGADEEIIPMSSRFTSNVHSVSESIFQHWKRQDEYWQIEIEGDELKNFVKAMPRNYMPLNKKTGGLPSGTDRIFFHYFSFKEGVVFAGAANPFSEQEISIMKRFTKVFAFAYTRYLDLQKAENQAREAKIEAALERIRSRTMAMQHSEELQEAALLLFHQVKDLGVEPGSCGFNIWEKNTNNTRSWMSSPQGGFQPSFKLSHSESPIYKDVYSAMEKGEEFFVRESSGEELKNHFKYLTTVPVIGDVIKKYFETGYQFPEKIFYQIAFFKQGYLTFHLHEPSSEAIDIFKRFANVFEQTYTRFLDLKKAEAQAREAQIEASLERVRAHAMAMHNSADLSSTVNIFFKELKTLGITPMRCGVGEMLEETHTSDLVFTTADKQGELYELPGKLKHEGHPVVENIYNYWKRQEEYHPVLQGADINAYYRVIKSQMALPDFPEYAIHFGNYFYFREGYFFA
ncbi:MAG TPA: nuclear transport factor 2 family protein, partial [Ignavibacteriaceae bacterium]|nr:nuclear transport factor 2 family protein [Ignavibacteriaceae bacterium]